jgi:hypothetical protein
MVSTTEAIRLALMKRRQVCDHRELLFMYNGGYFDNKKTRDAIT